MNPEVERLRGIVDFRRFYAHLGAEPDDNRGDQQDVLCCFHQESDPSLSLNLVTGEFHCKVPACPGSQGGDFVTAWMLSRGISFPETLREIAAWAPDNGTETKGKSASQKKPAVPTPDELAVRARSAHTLLMNARKPACRAAKLALQQRRGWTDDTLRKFQIGIDGNRYVIPILDAERRVANLRFYSWTEVPKMLSVPGIGQARIFEVSGAPEAREVLLCEGEPDAITAVQFGLDRTPSGEVRAVVTGTGGAGMWPQEWSKLLRGKEVIVCYDRDDAGSEGAARVAASLAGIARRVVRVDVPELDGVKDLSDWLLSALDAERPLAAGLPQVTEEEFVRSVRLWFERVVSEARAAVIATETPPTPMFIGLNEVGEYFGNVRWVWQDWIPRGHLTMLAGVSGVGKSYLAASIIAAITGAGTFPDGVQVQQAGPVCMVETEEFRGPYVQRLLAHGVKPADVAFPVIDLDPTYLLDLVKEIPLIESVCGSINSAAIVVDSLSAGHSMDENSAEMRGLLRDLAKLAGTLDLPIILVHHVRKRAIYETEQITLDRIRGSSTIIQFCRSIWGVWRPDPEVQDVRVESVKNSFSAPPEAFGFRITNGGRVEYVAAPETARSETTTDRAAEYLRVALRSKPLKYHELQEGADAMAISKNGLYRAKEKMGIVIVGGLWSLPVKGA